MAIDAPPTSPSPALMRRIEQFRQEQARRKAAGYDPERELGILLRTHFGLDALEETYQEYQREKHTWLDRDEDSTADER